MDKPTTVDDFRRFLGLPEHLGAHFQGWRNEIEQWEREQCAVVADQHRGSAAKKRQVKGQRLSTFDDGLAVEIQAEERGEDIAAEIIAREIRERGPVPSPDDRRG